MKKGFTLIELLAVITVLAIILIIAVPNIQHLINENRKNTFLINAKSIIKQIKYEDKTFTTSTLSELNLEGITKDGYDANLSTAYISDEEIHLNLVGTGQYEGMYLCGVNLTTNKSEVQNTPCEELEKYIVTFDPNGGSVAISNKEVIYNGTYGTLPVPKREGYKFLGWNGKNLLNPNNEYAERYDGYVSRSLIDYNELDNVYTSHANNSHHIYGFNVISVIDFNKTYTFSVNIVQNGSNEYTHIGYDTLDSGERKVYYSNIMTNENQTISYNINPNSTITSCIVGINNHAQGDGVKYNKLQLEEGNTATEYEPYYVTKDVKVTQRKNHTLKAIWEEI